MKAAFAPLGFALGASAASLVARDQCCFSLTASGGVSGIVGQLSDGQNRIAQTAGLANGQGEYCLNNGQITDGNGRGCILTPPTTQFQCDVGATPTGGFSVANGELTYNGNTQFYACPTGDNGGYNIYTTPVPNQDLCVKVTLSTGGKCNASGGSSSAPASSAPASSAPASSAPASKPATTVVTTQAPGTYTIYSTHYATITSCGPEVTNCPAGSTVVSSQVHTTTTVHGSTAPATSAPASSAPASSAPASSAPATTAKPSSASASGSACATTLSGAYQTPHAIIPVNANQPSTSYGTQYDAYIGGGNSTIFNFDFPASYSGKQCSLVFLFPKQSQLETSSFTLSGSGGLTFEHLASTAALSVSYDSAPKSAGTLNTFSSVTPGNSYVVANFACPAGVSESVEVSATGSLDLEYFQDWNPSPIGLFVTTC